MSTPIRLFEEEFVPYGKQPASEYAVVKTSREGILRSVADEVSDLVLVISIPSVIVPFSSNIILHPDHPLFADVRLTAQEPIPIDRRLCRS